MPNIFEQVFILFHVGYNNKKLHANTIIMQWSALVQILKKLSQLCNILLAYCRLEIGT